MSNPYPKIFLQKGKEAPVRRFHPWIFSGAIKKREGEIKVGDIVEVFDFKENYLATGYFQDDSIAVKLLSFSNEKIDEDFWVNKIEQAMSLRKQLGLFENEETNIFRLINSEGDGVPGLIIDFYNGTIVLQAHAVGIFNQRESIANALLKVLKRNVHTIYSKSKETLPAGDEINDADGFLKGSTEESVCMENGHRFLINWRTGQKTGFFIDQRENRQLLTKYVQGKKVLNAYSYSGGFSIYALNSGAAFVHSVDRSKTAIELLARNLELSEQSVSRHQSYVADVHQFLQNPEGKYDVIILDPPAFAKHFEARHRAVKGYKNINAMAIKSINKGGLLFTFSCSNVVDRNLFNSTIMAAAIEAGRKVQIIHQLSQAPDHPVNIFHPEGGYLKGLVVYVE